MALQHILDGIKKNTRKIKKYSKSQSAICKLQACNMRIVFRNSHSFFKPFSSKISCIQILPQKSYSESQSRSQKQKANSEAPWRIEKPLEMKDRPRRRGVSGGMDGRCREALSERSETKRVWLHGTRTVFPQ